MKRAASIVAVVAIAIWFFFVRTQPREMSREKEPADVPAESTTRVEEQEERNLAAAEVRELHELLGGFLTAVKEPYRPPLGINEDVARALTGGNRYGDVFLATNHPSLNQHGQIVDRWGTPYHFHPRAPDAIDIRSAGPDRKLFTPDDVMDAR